jgi:hypothetical protein
MTIQFIKDYTGTDGRRRRKGEVAVVGERVADELVRAGVAKERPPVGPVERKEAV